MLQEVDMASNTPITDSRFTSLSDLVLANASEFTPLVKESDDETVGALPKQFKACIITDVDQANMAVIDAARTLVISLSFKETSLPPSVVPSPTYNFLVSVV